MEHSRGRGSLSAEFCEGRPKSVVVYGKVDAVRELITQDSHITNIL